MKKRNFMKAKNSFLGRVLRRLLGEENGAVMMEYIVIGLLIAAVAVVAVGYFGTTISQMFAALTHATSAQPTAASGTVTAAKATANAAPGASNTHRGLIQANNGTADTTDSTAQAGW